MAFCSLHINMDLITVVEDWNTPDHRMVGVGITIPSLTRALQGNCRRGQTAAHWIGGICYALQILQDQHC